MRKRKGLFLFFVLVCFFFTQRTDWNEGQKSEDTITVSKLETSKQREAPVALKLITTIQFMPLNRIIHKRLVIFFTAVYGFSSNEEAGTGILVFPGQAAIKQAMFCNTR